MNKDINVVSIERKKYLKSIQKKKVMVFVTQISILIIFLVIWEVLARKGIIASFITSQPSRILKTFMNLSSNDLVRHILVTTMETVIGFLLGTTLGVLIAIILWWSDFLSKVFDPYLVVLNSLPKVALRTYNYNMGWCRNVSYYSNGSSNFSYSNNFGEFKWISKN